MFKKLMIVAGVLMLLPRFASAEPVLHSVQRRVIRRVYEVHETTRRVYENVTATRRFAGSRARFASQAYQVPAPVAAVAVAPLVYAVPLAGPVAYPTYPLPTTSSTIFNRPLVWAAGWPARAGYGYFAAGPACGCY